MGFSVEQVAALAYLKLSEEEKSAFEAQFRDILNYVDQLQNVPMSAEEAHAMSAFHVQKAFYEQLKMPFSSKLRDENKEMPEWEKLKLSNEEALANAPKKSGLPQELLFEVPSIIDREV